MNVNKWVPRTLAIAGLLTFVFSAAWAEDGAVPRFSHKSPIADPFFPLDRLVFPENDFDYSAYPASITGYTGQNLQRIGTINWSPATRVRVGQRGYYKPAIARRPGGSLVIAVCQMHPEYYRDAASKYFEIHLLESTDRGRTWKRIEQTELVGKEPSLAILSDGVMLLTSQNADYRPAAAKGPMNVYRSSDGGRSWNRIKLDTGDDPYPYPRSILVDKDNSLTFLFAHGNDLMRCRSKDGGRAWTKSVEKVAWDPKDIASTLFAEVGITRLHDGRLLATLRREIPKTEGEGFEDTFLTESTDDGQSWSRPWRISGTAEVHGYVIELADSRLLMTWSNYHLPYGVVAAVSTDGGRTWGRDQTIQLAVSANCYTGWASTVQLGDGSLVTAYATTIYVPEKDKPKSACEAVRWRLP